MERIDVAVGIDIGGTNTKYGVVDTAGNYYAKGELKTQDYLEFDLFVEHLGGIILDSIHDVKDNLYVLGIGMGVPNGNYYTGTVEFAPNLPWKGIINVKEKFAKKTNLAVIITNDANAAAYGEMIYGAAKGMNDFIVITLGTGLGSGIVVNGKMVYGHDGFAGEIGHAVLIPDGRPCGCGRKGCLEAYCSATGLRLTYLENIDKSKLTVEENVIDAKYIFDQARKGDMPAINTFDKTGELLGLALANSVAHTSPEAIFLFGGLANAGDLIFDPTRKSFEKNLLNIYKSKVKLLPSGLKEGDAAVLGAASLIWNANL
jgi:glucokinase